MIKGQNTDVAPGKGRVVEVDDEQWNTPNVDDQGSAHGCVAGYGLYGGNR